MIDIAMKKQCCPPDHVQVLDSVKASVYLLKALFPPKIVHRIYSREALGARFDYGVV